MSPRRCEAQRGALLVEFALIAFALYLLLGALLSFGTMFHAAQVAQDVARLAARELALTPLPATITFEQALDATSDRVFDANQLVVDLDELAAQGIQIDDHFATMPVVNRALRPVFVFDRVAGTRVLRFPGAILKSPQRTQFNAGMTVGVPQVIARQDSGGEIVRWLPVVEEIRAGTSDVGPFSAASTGPERGLVALRINIPATASALASYDAPTMWPPEPNAGNPHVIGPVSSAPGSAPPYGTPFSGAVSDGPGVIGGDQGLGEAGSLDFGVRPFRRVFVGQALFRREVYQ